MTISTETAIVKPFMIGRSQAIRLPKNFRLDASEVEIRREGKKLVLTPRKGEKEKFLEALGEFEGLELDSFTTRGVRPGYPRMKIGEDLRRYEERVRAYENRGEHE